MARPHGRCQLHGRIIQQMRQHGPRHIPDQASQANRPGDGALPQHCQGDGGGTEDLGAEGVEDDEGGRPGVGQGVEADKGGAPLDGGGGGLVAGFEEVVGTEHGEGDRPDGRG